MNEVKLHDYDLEEVVLGAVIIESKLLNSIAPEWDEDIFFKPDYRTMAWAVGCLHKESKPIEAITLANFLKSQNLLEKVGGAYGISQLTNRVASTANTEYWFRKLKELHMLRRLAVLGQQLKQDVLEPQVDPFDLIAKYDKQINSLTSGLVRMQVKSISKIGSANIERYKQINSGHVQTGLYTGFNSLQRHFGGWQKGSLVILAARPAMGKTSLMCSFALEPALTFNKPVVVFSLELSEFQLGAKFMSLTTDFDNSKLIRGELTKDEIASLQMSVYSLFGKLPIFIDDTPAISIYELRQKARRLKEEHDIQGILIDYLQLMTAEGRNREQEIAYISRSLKALAKELDIPIIALSQLSRDTEKQSTKHKIPKLSDLRESGAIEQDADVVIFIYRPEYYGLDVFEDDMDARGKAELIIAKNRFGAAGVSAITGFEARRTRFFCLDQLPPTKPVVIQPNNEFFN